MVDTVLSAVDGIRLRPGMYIGSTDTRGLHALLLQVIDTALLESRRGTAKHVRIELDGERATVEDDGRGIPPHTFDVMFSHLHGGPFDPFVDDPSTKRAGMFGTGLVVANALSSEFEITVWRDGRTFTQRFARGVPLGPVAAGDATTRTGTRLRCVPDPELFGSTTWDIGMLVDRCRELAALHAGVTITVDGERMHYASIVDHVRYLAGRDDLLDPLHVRGEHAGVKVEAAIAWSDRSVVQAFVNRHACSGPHVDALHSAVRIALGRRVKFPPRLSRGLVAELALELAQPLFKTMWRDALDNPEAADAVRAIVAPALVQHLDATPALLDWLLLECERDDKRAKRPRPPRR